MRYRGRGRQPPGVALPLPRRCTWAAWTLLRAWELLGATGSNACRPDLCSAVVGKAARTAGLPRARALESGPSRRSPALSPAPHTLCWPVCEGSGDRVSSDMATAATLWAALTLLLLLQPSAARYVPAKSQPPVAAPPQFIVFTCVYIFCVSRPAFAIGPCLLWRRNACGSVQLAANSGGVRRR